MAVVTNTERGSMTTPFVSAVILAGATVFAQSVYQLSTAPVGSQWFILVALTLLTGSFTIAMSSLSVRVSVSETFVFASVLMFGTAAGTVTVVLETLVMSFLAAAAESSAAACAFQCRRACGRDLGLWHRLLLVLWDNAVSPTRHATASPFLATGRVYDSLLPTQHLARGSGCRLPQEPIAAADLVASVHLGLRELLQRCVRRSTTGHL